MDPNDDRAAAVCPPGGERGLTGGEIALVRSVFGDAIDCARVRIKRRKWFPLQPASVVMAPWGHIHFHPRSTAYCDDFALAALPLQGLFIHEMTHVWQTQRRGWWYLPLVRPFSRRYDYVLEAGKPFAAYGIEQQAEIVRDTLLMQLRTGRQQHGLPAEHARLMREIASA